MPLIKPEVQKILREAGLSKDLSSSLDSDNLSLEQHLTQAGMSSEAIAENLTELALRSGNDGLRLRALETALKIKGALKETASELPNFTIIIQSGSQETARTGGVNPILFPRQSLNSLNTLNQGPNTNVHLQSGEPSQNNDKGPLKN